MITKLHRKKSFLCIILAAASTLMLTQQAAHGADVGGAIRRFFLGSKKDGCKDKREALKKAAMDAGHLESRENPDWSPSDWNTNRWDYVRVGGTVGGFSADKIEKLPCDVIERLFKEHLGEGGQRPTTGVGADQQEPPPVREIIQGVDPNDQAAADAAAEALSPFLDAMFGAPRSGPNPKGPQHGDADRQSSGDSPEPESLLDELLGVHEPPGLGSDAAVSAVAGEAPPRAASERAKRQKEGVDYFASGRKGGGQSSVDTHIEIADYLASDPGTESDLGDFGSALGAGIGEFGRTLNPASSTDPTVPDPIRDVAGEAPGVGPLATIVPAALAGITRYQYERAGSEVAKLEHQIAQTKAAHDYLGQKMVEAMAPGRYSPESHERYLEQQVKLSNSLAQLQQRRDAAARTRAQAYDVLVKNGHLSPPWYD